MEVVETTNAGFNVPECITAIQCKNHTKYSRLEKADMFFLFFSAWETRSHWNGTEIVHMHFSLFQTSGLKCCCSTVFRWRSKARTEIPLAPLIVVSRTALWVMYKKPFIKVKTDQHVDERTKVNSEFQNKTLRIHLTIKINMQVVQGGFFL